MCHNLEDNKVYTKPAPKVYKLKYIVTQDMIETEQPKHQDLLPLITRCDLFDSIKVDGEEIDLSTKERTPKVFNYDYGAIRNDVNTLVFSNSYYNDEYVLTKHFDSPTEGEIEVTWNNDVNDLNGAFYECVTLQSIPDNLFENFAPSVSLSYLFYDCYSLETADVSYLNTDNVKYMNDMFYNCKKISQLELSNWNTDNVISMTEPEIFPYESGTFCGCESLVSLGENNGKNLFNGNITSMKCLFYNCTKLEHLDTSNWNTSKVTNMYATFENCKVLNDIDVSKWNTSNVTNMFRLFGHCDNIVNLEVSDWNTANVTDFSGVFYSCGSLRNLGQTNVSNWNLSNASRIAYFFANDEFIEELDVSNWNVSNITDFSYIFYLLENVNKLEVSNWDVSRGTTFASMFERCRRITTFGEGSLSKWRLNNTTDLNKTFSLITSGNLDYLDVSNVNMSKVTDVSSMFRQLDTSLLDLSNWSTSDLANITTDKMSAMFYAINIDTIRCKQDVKDWIISNSQYNSLPESYKTDESKWEIVN